MTGSHRKPKQEKKSIMKNRRNILTYIVAALSILVVSASWSPAAPGQTYHGTLTSGEFLCGSTAVPGPAVTGNWNVIIDPKTPAQVSLNVFYDGGHHLAFGYNALMLVWFAKGVYTFSGFGDAVTVTLDTTKTPATFSWHVQLSGGCPAERPYDSLSYLGVATRGGG
jgi:hypothetical protein